MLRSGYLRQQSSLPRVPSPSRQTLWLRERERLNAVRVQCRHCLLAQSAGALAGAPLRNVARSLHFQGFSNWACAAMMESTDLRGRGVPFFF
jgi:hypothetical protein